MTVRSRLLDSSGSTEVGFRYDFEIKLRVRYDHEISRYFLFCVDEILFSRRLPLFVCLEF